MPDFPSGMLAFGYSGIITTMSKASLMGDHNSTFASGGVWPAANRALYLPFIMETTATATQMFFQVTVQSGNCDVGIYGVNGVRMITAGSTAVAAAGVQTVNITDTVLTPGVYYMALNIDNVTAAVTRNAVLIGLGAQVFGMQQQAVGAVTLPNPGPATFANPASAYIPMIGVAFRATL